MSSSAPELFLHRPTADPRRATLDIDSQRRAALPLHAHLLGKFCEHLGANIYQGMDAQILFNATFAKWRFAAEDHPDGGMGEESDRAKIREFATRMDHWPEPARVVDAYFNGGAWGWFRVGGADDAVRLSPDVTACGNRAQRVEMLRASVDSPSGIAQWMHLPLHRTRGYHYRLVARAVTPCTIELRLAPTEGEASPVSISLEIDGDWGVYRGQLMLPADWPPEALYTFSLVATTPAHVLIARVGLLPDDHIDGADLEVIRLLREAHLPLLRWPGGNFVSGYHWQDGVGPVDDRPTRFNPAWAGVESNAFGTDEFLAFCRAIGCAPLICVNAGSGTPEEAAAWIEYCNGSVVTPFGALRAANGHPEPYDVKLWEIGNELWGRWQVGWTTGAGYADRFVRFAEAMHQVDPTIELLATGTPGLQDDEWTKALLATQSSHLRCVTDHTLSASLVGPRDDPWDVFQGYAGQPAAFDGQYRWFRGAMEAAGITQPHMALTEMIVFADWDWQAEAIAGGMTREQMVDHVTIAEAVYFAAFLCECARLDGFVRLITHTATVNHGGGLRKWHERVWGDPVHHCHVLAAPLAGATPVGATLACGTYTTKRGYGAIPILQQVSVLDAVAAVAATGELVILLVQRARESVVLHLQLRNLTRETTAEVSTLAGIVPWERNDEADPRRIIPRVTSVPVTAGGVTLDLPPCSVTRVIINE